MKSDTLLLDIVVDKLKFSYSSPDLNEKIRSQLGESYTGQLAFRVKQEILRKARLSRRPLQINEWISKLDATPYMVDGVCHYLDPLSYQFFKKLYDAYGQKYTIDVEESVIAYIKTKKQDILNFQSNKGVKVEYLQLAENAYRKEERMHLAIRIHVDSVKEVGRETLVSKNDMINASEALTSNISLSGLKIKHEGEGVVGKVYAVRFTGWESEFVLPPNPVLYRLVKQEEIGDNTGEFSFFWYLVMVDNTNHMQFILFLSKIIQSNRLRYRVDTENIERSIVNGIAEQFFLNREEGVSLFLDKFGKVKYILGNNTGHDFYNSFLFDGKDTLLYLLERDGVLKANLGERFFFCGFTQRNGVHFYTKVSNDDLLSAQFFQYASSRPDVKLFQVDVFSSDNNNAFYSHNIPADVVSNLRGGKLKRSVNEYSDEVRKKVLSLDRLISITPLCADALFSFFPYVGQLEQDITSGFKKFALMKAFSSDTPFIRVKNHELRRQDRYVINTKAVLLESGAEAQVMDVSLAGISLSLPSPKLFNVGALVSLSFPELSTINHLPPQATYKVVYSDSSTLRLAGEIDGDLVERRYWGAFFDKYASSLELSGVGSEKGEVGLERALRNIVRCSNSSLHALFSVKGSRVTVTHVNVPDSKGEEPMFALNEDTAKPSAFYKTLFCDMGLQDYLSRELRKINKKNPFSKVVIAVCYDKRPMFTPRVLAVKLFDSNLCSVNQLLAYSRLMESRGGRVSYFTLSITRKSRVFDRYYVDEMSYLMNVSVHRAEKLRTIVSSTSGVIKLTPINRWIDICEKVDRNSNKNSSALMSF